MCSDTRGVLWPGFQSAGHCPAVEPTSPVPPAAPVALLASGEPSARAGWGAPGGSGGAGSRGGARAPSASALAFLATGVCEEQRAGAWPRAPVAARGGCSAAAYISVPAAVAVCE